MVYTSLQFVAACRVIGKHNNLPASTKWLYSSIKLGRTERCALNETTYAHSVFSDRLTLGEVLRDSSLPKSSPVSITIVDLSRPNLSQAANRTVARHHAATSTVSPVARLSTLHKPIRTEKEDEDQMDHMTTFTYYPLGESSFPMAATLRRDACASDFLHGPISLDNAPTGPRCETSVPLKNIVGELQKKVFEAHPGSETTLSSLAFGNFPLIDLQRLTNQLGLRGSPFRRTVSWTLLPCFFHMHKVSQCFCSASRKTTCHVQSQWCPAFMQAFTDDTLVLAKVAPVETIVGFDYPEYNRTSTLGLHDVVPIFSEKDKLSKRSPGVRQLYQMNDAMRTKPSPHAYFSFR